MRVRKVLRCLDKAQSTYNAPFAKLCKELFHARAEANDNVKFLAPLRKWVEQLEDCTDYSTLPEVYPPIVHTILLIWKGSGHYNTPTRLSSVRERGLQRPCSTIPAVPREHERL